MGTSADFFVKHSNGYQYVGGVEWDGEPLNIWQSIYENSSQEDFLESVSEFLDDRAEGVIREQDGIAEYNYIYDNGVIYISNSGGILHTINEVHGYDEYCAQCDEDDQDPMEFEKYLEQFGLDQYPEI